MTSPKSYNWIAPSINWQGVDAMEVWGVIEDVEADCCEPCHTPDEKPTFWSAYVHRDGSLGPEGAGLECVADFDTRREALDWASSQANSRDLALYDYTFAPQEEA